MTLSQFGGLLVVYLVRVLFILTLTYQEFRRIRFNFNFNFNFNLFFSLLYLLTFYFGFPLTCLLVFQFDVEVVPVTFLLYAMLSATAFYASYKTRLRQHRPQRSTALFTMNRVETHLTWMLLAVGTVGIFFMQKGLLLFKLNSYSQIFSSNVSGVALKRFFYFFIPPMLVVYFLRQDRRTWFFFLVATVAFVTLTYVIVGGTRANIIIAFALFLFIGILRGWISLWMLAVV